MSVRECLVYKVWLLYIFGTTATLPDPRSARLNVLGRFSRGVSTTTLEALVGGNAPMNE